MVSSHMSIAAPAIPGLLLNRNAITVNGDTLVSETEGFPVHSVENASPLIGLVNVLAQNRLTVIPLHTQSGFDAKVMLSMMQEEEERNLRIAVGGIVTNPKCFTAIAAAVDSPQAYSKGAYLRVGCHDSDELKRAIGGSARYFYAPRIIHKDEEVFGARTGGDTSEVSISLDIETGQSVILLDAFDGVTSWNSVGKDDNIASGYWRELIANISNEELRAQPNLKTLILELNKRFIKKCVDTDRPGLMGTLAMARVKREKAGDRHVELACVGDAKATVIWIDEHDELHTVTVENPINREVDLFTAGMTHAAHMTGDGKFDELAQVFKRTSYMDKFAHGDGTVGILGRDTLTEGNIATHEVVIPGNAKFFKVITHTDGVELYAKLLEIPPWLCALLFEQHPAGFQRINSLVYGTGGMAKEQLFPGAAPFGIAVVHAMYALLHPDAYPFDAELRNKWDDAAAASFGDDAGMVFELIQERARQLKPNVKIASYAASVDKLTDWYLGELNKVFAEIEEVALRGEATAPTGRKRHRKHGR